MDLDIIKLDDIVLSIVKIDSFEIDESLFSGYRRKRLGELKTDLLKKQSCAAEYALICAMQAYSNEILPPFEYFASEHGKPEFIEYKSIHFSLSHSGDYAVCAIGERPVGIDVEKKHDIISGVVDKYYNPAEAKMDFTDVWTRKEAVVKADGRGIAADLSQIDVSADTAQCSEKKYHLYKIDAPEGYFISVATLIDF